MRKKGRGCDKNRARDGTTHACTSAQQKRLWNCQPEHLGGLKVDNELKLRRVLHWQVSRLGTAQYAVDISRRLLKLVQQIDAIRDQSASFGIKSQWIERRQTQASG